ncbi:DUF4347 domain-containing protein, partial [Undibacterium danionis]
MTYESNAVTTENTTKYNQIAFIDKRLPDYETIVKNLASNIQVVLLDGGANGLQTILSAFDGRTMYDAIHLFSHGSAASLQLGDSYLNINTLNWSDNQSALEKIGAVLKPGGDFFIYACELAKGADGLQFIEDLAQRTGSKVSASDDTTGANHLGGNWNLEVTADASGHLIQQSALGQATNASIAIQMQTYDAILSGTLSGTAVVDVATGHDYLSATPGTTPLNAQGAIELSNGTRVVLLANTRADYYGMANLDNLQIALVDGAGTVTTTVLTGQVANVINNNGGNTHDSSSTQTNDGANIVALKNGFVVTSYSNDGYGVQMYNNAGTSLNISAPGSYTSSVNPNSYAIASSDGGFILLWTKNNYQTLEFQRYDSIGNQVGSTVSTAFTTTTPVIQGAAVDANGNLAIPVSSNDVYTHSQVMMWSAANSLTGTYDTPYYQVAPNVAAIYGGGFDLFGNDIASGVGNTSSSYYIQSLAPDGSLSKLISNTIQIGQIKSISRSLSGDYFIVGGADSSSNDGYFVNGFNPSTASTSLIVSDATKLVTAPTLSADGDVIGAWSNNPTKQANGFITDGTISTVNYNAAYPAGNLPPTISGSYINNGMLDDNASTNPFAGLSVSDADSANGFLTITYNSANGTLSGAGLTGTAGNYTLALGGTSFTSLSSQLRALVFNPTSNQVAPGNSITTTFTITPSDGLRSGRANTFTNETALSINDGPLIDSNGGGASATINVTENTTAVTTVHASDPDVGGGPTVVYSKSGTDAALFNLNTSTGQLSFITAPNFEAPGDADHNNVYNVTVTASDGSLSDTQTLAITVVNANEAPTITSNGGGASAAISIAENQTAITTVQASDVDAATTITYSISGTDAALFDINSATGVLTFKNAPNFEAPADSGANNVYDIIVSASDGALSDTQAISIMVTNANDAPIISGLSSADNQTVSASASAILIDLGTPTTVSDDDNANFNNGSLTIAFTSGRASGDVLSFFVGGSISLSNGSNVGSNVSVGGQNIGSIANNGTGIGGDNLIINLNSAATAARVSTLLQNITFDATGTQGDRVISATLNDGQLNSNSASTTITVNTNPTVAITSNSNVLKAGESAIITFTFNETPVGFTDTDITLTGGSISALTVDAIDNKIYTATFTPTAATQSLNASINVAANTFKNAANEDNLASTTNVSITGDTLTPWITSIVRQSPASATTNSSSVTYAVSFNESVSGVDISDFSLTKTGATVGNISAISGSGSSYIVTVNGISGDGTLRLDLNASGTNISDAASNAINVGFISGQTYTIDQPAIISANYDANSGSLVVTGKSFVLGDAIDVSKLSIIGQGGGSYTLTSPSVTASSTTAFSVTLNAADKLAINGLLNKDGTTAVDTTSFNLAAAASWNATTTSGADLTGNAITVSNVTAPTITSAAYDGTSHVFTITGTNLVKTIGATNDVTISALTITGEGGATRTLSTTGNVEITSATSFTFTLSGADIAAVDLLLNKNGSSSAVSATAYNIAAADDWNSVITGGNIADLTGNAITVSNAAPNILNATYD